MQSVAFTSMGLKVSVKVNLYSAAFVLVGLKASVKFNILGRLRKETEMLSLLMTDLTPALDPTVMRHELRHP